MNSTRWNREEIEESYRPPRWLAGGHRMTIAAAYWPRRFRRAGVASREVAVRVAPDVDVWVEIDEPESPARGTLVLVHGLTGSARSNYMLGTADAAVARNLRAARVNLRGCAARQVAPTDLYHGGMSGDLAAIVAALGAEYPGPFALVGFSLGGNLVARLAATTRTGDGSRITGFACVSAPLDLAACAERIDRPGFSSLYRRHFVTRLVAEYLRRCRAAPERFDPGAVRGVRGVIAFDEAVTAPCFGFESARHYYSVCSAARDLHSLEVPTLFVSAKDDPIVDPAVYSAVARRAQPAVRIVTPSHGGHLGFVSRSSAQTPGGGGRFWAENLVVDFLTSESFAARGI